MVTTKMTWNNASYFTIPMLVSEKETFINLAKSAGKTDGTHTIISDTESSRTWVDQAAADEWTTFVTNLATKYGYTVTVTVV